jgi:hypothetical protein
MPTPVPARLHVILARDAPAAVIVRRGPSRHTAVIGWNRRTDKFTLGQWLYGRIYERRSDLSPDGKHFIYFAMNGRWQSSSKGSWTAISRAPYLHALAFYAKGDCWHGGGLFTSNGEYWLNDGYGHELQRDTSALTRSKKPPSKAQFGAECLSVYFPRLLRDGWTLVSTTKADARSSITRFEKEANEHWSLVKFAHATLDHPVGRGVYFDTHQLFNAKTGEVIDCPDWEWADIDGRSLVWAERGGLHRARLGKGGLLDEKLLHDFNPMTFEKLIAPY